MMVRVARLEKSYAIAEAQWFLTGGVSWSELVWLESLQVLGSHISECGPATMYCNIRRAWGNIPLGLGHQVYAAVFADGLPHPCPRAPYAHAFVWYPCG
jgi:hypothetical protein